MRFAIYFSISITSLLISQLFAFAELTPPKGFQLRNSITFTTSTVTQHGITWTFNTDYTVGQFVNGDYYVVDPGGGVRITNISPGYTASPRAMNGSMINPSATTQGYDGYQSYSSSVNVGIGISPSTPLVLSGNVSLVSTISNSSPGGNNHISYVNSVAVLTCLSSAPPANSFRPGISSITKTLHNFSSVNTSLLGNLVYAGKGDISAMANKLQMAWLDHSGSWVARYMHASASGIDNYYYAVFFGDAAIALHLDYTLEQKTQLLVNFIQLGIDLYSFIERGGTGWVPDGGQANGRKWPIIFAGLMLDYAPMKNIGQRSGDYLYSNGHGPGNPPSDFVYFGEDGQTFYVRQYDVDLTHSGSWAPDTRNSDGCDPYTTAMIGMPEWGIRASTHPQYSDASWSAMYRSIGSATPSWINFILASYVMGAKGLWNHNCFFDYMDRYIAISTGQPDPFGYTVPDQHSGSAPNLTLWNLYRQQYTGYPSKRK